jgi:hypothetical protein
MKFFYSLFLMLSFVLSIKAQTSETTGKVIKAKTAKNITTANVITSDLQVSTSATDPNGKYYFELKDSTYTLTLKAQTGKITGKVIDAKTAETIMAANILFWS